MEKRYIKLTRLDESVEFYPLEDVRFRYSDEQLTINIDYSSGKEDIVPVNGNAYTVECFLKGNESLLYQHEC